ncbi:MAG: 16S rRNA (cytidine(1402)-2'-O)-methyltransferase [Chloroflexota bacterium]
MGTLYLVGTPIGNLEDVTLRALRILREVPLIAAEDTRQTRKLLDRYDIHQPLVSYFEHNERARVGPLLDRLQHGDLALVSEAGMPAISDPGYALVTAAIDAGIPVVPIPGPSAPIAALAASGLPTDQFVYLGFLPRRSGERRKLLRTIVHEPRTIVAFEAPHRLVDSLEDVVAELGDRRVVVARELTKIHEELARGVASDLLAGLRESPPRGEVTLVIEGAVEGEPVDLATRLRELIDDGLSNRDVIGTLVAETGAPRRHIYRLLLDARKCVKM